MIFSNKVNRLAHPAIDVCHHHGINCQNHFHFVESSQTKGFQIHIIYSLSGCGMLSKSGKWTLDPNPTAAYCKVDTTPHRYCNSSHANLVLGSTWLAEPQGPDFRVGEILSHAFTRSIFSSTLVIL